MAMAKMPTQGFKTAVHKPMVAIMDTTSIIYSVYDLPPSLSVPVLPVSVLPTSISRSSVCVSVPFGKAKGRCAHRDEGDSIPISFRQGEGREPPGTSTRLHLRGPCYGRRICSFACKSLPGAVRLPPNTGAQKHWRLINMKGI